MAFRSIIALVILAAVAACAPTPETANGIRLIPDSEIPAIQTAHVDAVNAFRSAQGLQPVRLSSQLTAAAATHARDMSVQRRAWHFGSDGTSPRDRALRAGFRGDILGENISESFDENLTVIQSWLNEQHTRAVMAAPAADSLGIAFYQEPNGKLWWVQLLGRSGGGFGLTPGS